MNIYVKLLVVILSCSLCFAGSLQPTAAPGPTMKTLDQLEPRTPITSVPFTITQSGSYYMTQNFNSVSTAITIDSNNVTIDLCGFTLKGPGSGANSGIQISSDRTNIEIRNGTIREFGHAGIIGGTNGNYCKIIEIKAISNGYSGIVLESENNIVKDCTVSDNGTALTEWVYGITTSQGSKIINNIVFNNGSAAGHVVGIFTTNSIITGNVVSENGSSANGNVTGIYGVNGSQITDNTICYNGASAKHDVKSIRAERANIIKGNIIYGNGGMAEGTVYGIYILQNNLVDQNVASFNGDNIYEDGTGNVITANNVLP